MILFSSESFDGSLNQGLIVVRVPLDMFPIINVGPLLVGILGHMLVCHNGCRRFMRMIIEMIILVVAILILLILPPVLFVKGTVTNLIQCTHRWAARWVILHMYRA